jgi:hypothetical protein
MAARVILEIRAEVPWLYSSSWRKTYVTASPYVHTPCSIIDTAVCKYCKGLTDTAPPFIITL